MTAPTAVSIEQQVAELEQKVDSALATLKMVHALVLQVQHDINVNVSDVEQELATLAARIGVMQDALATQSSASASAQWGASALDEEHAAEVLRTYALRINRVLDLEGSLLPHQISVLLTYEARDALRTLREAGRTNHE